MSTSAVPRLSASVVLPKTSLQSIFDNLSSAGFTLIGPTVRDGAAVLDEIHSVDDLPVGYHDEHRPGYYRLNKSSDGQWFSHNLGAHSWKKFLHPSSITLYSVSRTSGQWVLQRPEKFAPRYAFIGARSCDLHAISIQDRVFMAEQYRDPHYGRRREQIFLLAANCSTASSSCFCTSMRTGPRATEGFDLALTELPETFLLEVGSEAGSEMMRGTGWQPATAFDLGRAAQVLQNTERQIHREMRTDDLPQMLYRNLEHPRWSATAARCLSCANCTMVCPTCFCTTVEDTSDLHGTAAQRTRVWDSCFLLDFSHVHGGNLRPTVRSRYRQWLSHKLASWMDQFGRLGCVGCGRCITWCPVGIDITDEVKAIRATGVK
jgi:sulfhydrogenase subunit beta (sulfur reductase)